MTKSLIAVGTFPPVVPRDTTLSDSEEEGGSEGHWSDECDPEDLAGELGSPVRGRTVSGYRLRPRRRVTQFNPLVNFETAQDFGRVLELLESRSRLLSLERFYAAQHAASDSETEASEAD